MTVSMFLILLAAFATVTGLLTEAIKKLLDRRGGVYASNILALIVAIIVGIGGTAFYYVYAAIPFTIVNIISMFLMALANWLGATVGYDKVTQAIAQITGTHYL